MLVVSPKNDLERFVTGNIINNRIRRSSVVEILKKTGLNIDNIIIEEKEQELTEGCIEFLERYVKTGVDNKRIYSIKNKGALTTAKVDFVHKINGKNYSLPLEEQSQGTKHAYKLAGIMDLLVRESILMPIDQLESSLHTDLFIHFVLMHLVNSRNSQVIATTHNREVLKNKDIFRNDAIWFTDKSDEGNTLVYSLDDFDSKTIRDTSSVYNAYSIGKLGGVPELGDYYLDFKFDGDE